MNGNDRAEVIGWRRLACAVIVQACRDAHNTNGHQAAGGLGLPPGQSLSDDAKNFLHSSGADWLVSLLDDLDLDGLERLRAEVSPAEWVQCALPGLQRRTVAVKS